MQVAWTLAIQRVYHAPWGARVLKTIQELLALSCEDLAYSWDVLRDFGNMSSPTALFGLASAGKRRRSRATFAYGIRPRLLSLLCCR